VSSIPLSPTTDRVIRCRRLDRRSNRCSNPVADIEGRGQLCAKHTLEAWLDFEEAQVRTLRRNPRPIAAILPAVVDDLGRRQREYEARR